MGKPNHRVVAGTKKARKMAAENSRIATPKPLPQDVQEWNAHVEAAKAERKLCKVKL